MWMIDALIQELEQEAQTTRRVLERVPGDRLTWKRHVKSISLVQLTLHMATTHGMVSDIVRQSPFPMPEFTQPSAATAAELVPALDPSVAKAKANLRAIGDGRLGGMWRVVAGDKELM